METTKTITAVNNAEYQPERVENSINEINKYAESFKSQAFEIINNPNTTFSDFIDEQSIATGISILLGLKKGAMLNEQLTALGLHKIGNQKTFEKNESVNNTSFTGAPNLEPKVLGGYEAA